MPRRLCTLQVLVLGLIACGGVDPDAETQKRCPAARVDTPAAQFQLARLDAASVKSVVFRNGCTNPKGDLELTLRIDGDAGFDVSDTDLRVAPGQTVSVDVGYQPVDYAVTAARLVADTNDKAVPELVVGLSGTTAPDQDEDGFTAAEAGGSDCDDRDPAIRPGAAEIWYDGVDQNCDGLSDYDQDKDGADAAPEGDDCDDEDAGVGPGVPERDDAVDQDCDGTADEDFVRPHDVVVTEIMAQPAAVDPALGEWVEITNRSDRRRNLVGWRVTDYGDDAFVIGTDLILDPGARAVLASEADSERNGGVVVDVAYDRADFELADGVDAVGLEVAGLTVTLVEYDTSWPSRAGASISLDPLRLDPTTATRVDSWCYGETLMPGGDLGTPGADNPICDTVDHDGDGLSVADGDCDDTVDTVYPGAPERWNGVDDDCDTVIDAGDVATSRDAYLDGEPDSTLSYVTALSTGDVDDDGDLELLVGAPLVAGSFSGVVYTLDASDASTWAGLVETYDEAAVQGKRRADRLSALGPVQRDVTADGRVDLVVGGNGNNDFGGGAAIALYATGASISGTLDTDDADATWAGTDCTLDCQVISHLDMDGDGVAEVVVGDPLADGVPGRRGTVYLVDPVGASGANTLDDDAEVIWRGAAPDFQMGSSIDGADLDDDGYDELIACGRGATYTYYDAGACAIIAGSAARPDGGEVQAAALAAIGGADGGDRLGITARVGIGDFDGDLDLDLALANPEADEVVVFLGAGALSGQYDTDDADVVVAPTVGPSYFGASLAVGDVDGDGDDDLLVGATDSGILGDTTADDVGRVWLFRGPALTAVSTATESDAGGWLDGEEVGQNFGWALLAADLDGDGLDDVIVGEPGFDDGTGRVSVVLAR